MAIGRSWSIALVGLTGHLVEVEASMIASVPGFTLVGLPDVALGEARERVRAAVANSGLSWPNRKITVNLSPASLRKTGSGFDVAIAVAVMAAHGVVEPNLAARWVYLGELGLDGRLHPIRGILPAVAAAASAGFESVVVPEANLAEARLVPGMEVRGATTLGEVARYLGADIPIDDSQQPATPVVADSQVVREAGDFSDVLGQDEARFALEVAAAGGHHVLMVGPPGAGKTMLAARLTGILPELSDEDAVEVTAIHSVAGTFRPRDGLLRRPPFESPHHTSTTVAIVGGGSGLPQPGAATRAHRGVLLLDEAPEFSPRVLQSLRQPLESGELIIQRSGGVARYPSRFQLVLAANPCPCGRAFGKGSECSCSSLARRRYFSRISGPLLDRVDIQLAIAPVGSARRRSADAKGNAPESSATIAQRVAKARERSRARLGQTSWRTNGEVPGAWWRRTLPLPTQTTKDLDQALDRGRLSLRGFDRTIRVAWTIADLAGLEIPGIHEVGQALALRHGIGALA